VNSHGKDTLGELMMKVSPWSQSFSKGEPHRCCNA